MDYVLTLTEKLKEIVVFYGLRILVAIALLVLGLRLIRKIDEFMRSHFDLHAVDTSLKIFLMTSASIMLKLILLMTIAGVLGIRTTFFMTVIGSIGLTIGLALQGSLTNVAGGFLILFFRPFRIGDFIEAQGFQGTVKEINILWTLLNSPDNKIIHLPNGPLANGPITNNSMEENRRLDLVFTIDGTLDLKKIKEMLLRNVEMDRRCLKNPPPQVGIKEILPNAVKLGLQVWCHQQDFNTLMVDLQEKFKLDYDQELSQALAEKN